MLSPSLYIYICTCGVGQCHTTSRLNTTYPEGLSSEAVTRPSSEVALRCHADFPDLPLSHHRNDS